MGVETDATFLAEDDGIQVQFKVEEFPPVQLWVAPMELYLNGDLVVNDVNDDMWSADDDVLFIGDRTHRWEHVRVTKVEWVSEGPGPPGVKIWTETGFSPRGDL